MPETEGSNYDFFRRENIEKIEMEARLVAHRSPYVVSIQRFPGAAFILNESRQILASSDRCREILGVAADISLLGLRAGEALHCVHATEGTGGCGTSPICGSCAVLGRILDALRERSLSAAEGHVETADRTFFFQINSYPLAIDDSRFAIVTLVDISRRRALESQKEVFLDLLARTSHHFRTPMSGIVASLSLLEAEADISSFLPLMKDSVASMQGLVERLVDLAEAFSPASVDTEVSFSPAALLTDVAHSWADRFYSRGLEFVCENGVDGALGAMGHPRWIASALRELLSNALRFTPENGVVKLRCHATAEHVSERGGEGLLLVLEVSDTGRGISDDDRELVLRPFARSVHQPPQVSEGLGFGLSLVQRIATLLDGSLSIHSLPGAGSVFTLSLPLKGCHPISNP